LPGINLLWLWQERIHPRSRRRDGWPGCAGDRGWSRSCKGARYRSDGSWLAGDK